MENTATQELKDFKETVLFRVMEIIEESKNKHEAIEKIKQLDESTSEVIHRNPDGSWRFDDDTWLHCPVCNQVVRDYDICYNCNWQNTGIINIDGGPNRIPLKEAQRRYQRYRTIE